jgi:hypothetical protein
MNYGNVAVGGTTRAAAGLVQRLPLISGADYEADRLQSLETIIHAGMMAPQQMWLERREL